MANPSSNIPTWRIKPEIVDNVLGAGTYEHWLGHMDDFGEQQSLAASNETRYSGPSVASLKEQLQKDLAVANQIADDYWAFLVRVSSGAYVTSGDGENLVELFDLAYIILSNDNYVLDSMNALSIKVWLNALAATKLYVEANALQRLLKKLTAELKKAKSRARWAWGLTAIDLALSCIGLVTTGPLGAMAVVGGGIAKGILHKHLSPSTSDAAIVVRGTVTGYNDAVTAPLKYLDETGKVVKIPKLTQGAGAVGGILIVTGFVFDVDDALVDSGNVDELKKAMEEAKEAHEILVAKITRNKGIVMALAHQLAQLDLIVDNKQDKGLIAKAREKLEDKMKRMGYPTNIGTGFRLAYPEIQ